MEKLKFFDEALIDSIKKASVWKIKGSDYWVKFLVIQKLILSNELLLRNKSLKQSTV